MSRLAETIPVHFFYGRGVAPVVWEARDLGRWAAVHLWPDEVAAGVVDAGGGPVQQADERPELPAPFSVDKMGSLVIGGVERGVDGRRDDVQVEFEVLGWCGK